MATRFQRRFNDGGAPDGIAIGMGVLVGAALGAGAALLMAPASGEETRVRLRRGARRLQRQGTRVLEDLWDEADYRARRVARSAWRRGRAAAARAAAERVGAFEEAEAD
jgi:gas vesicle protein